MDMNLEHASIIDKKISSFARAVMQIFRLLCDPVIEAMIDL